MDPEEFDDVPGWNDTRQGEELILVQTRFDDTFFSDEWNGNEVPSISPSISLRDLDSLSQLPESELNDLESTVSQALFACRSVPAPYSPLVEADSIPGQAKKVRKRNAPSLIHHQTDCPEFLPKGAREVVEKLSRSLYWLREAFKVKSDLDKNKGIRVELMKHTEESVCKLLVTHLEQHLVSLPSLRPKEGNRIPQLSFIATLLQQGHATVRSLDEIEVVSPLDGITQGLAVESWVVKLKGSGLFGITIAVRINDTTNLLKKCLEKWINAQVECLFLSKMSVNSFIVPMPFLGSRRITHSF